MYPKAAHHLKYFYYSSDLIKLFGKITSLFWHTCIKFHSINFVYDVLLNTPPTVKPQLPPSTSSSADPQSKSVISSGTGSSVQQNPKGPVFTPMSATNLIDDRNYHIILCFHELVGGRNSKNAEFVGFWTQVYMNWKGLVAFLFLCMWGVYFKKLYYLIFYFNIKYATELFPFNTKLLNISIPISLYALILNLYILFPLVQHCGDFESKVLLADKPVIVLFYEK